MEDLLILYRISDCGNRKEKLDFISNESCLNNFLKEFSLDQLIIIADNVSDSTYDWLKTFKFKDLIRTSLGNSASFWYSYKLAIKYETYKYFYFVENDYIHLKNSKTVLFEGLQISDYVTLYDHPDKYRKDMNPHILHGGEKSRVYLTESTHWKWTNSTTMTFATHYNNLINDKFYFYLFTVGLRRKNPADYRIFRFLKIIKRRKLICPLPAYASHGEEKYLAPIINWGNFI